MNRALFTDLCFSKSSVPSIPCPSCQNGRLVKTDDSVRAWVNANSLKCSSDENWEHEFSVCHFSAILRCNDQSCKENVHVVGDSSEDAVYEEVDDFHGPIEHYITFYRPHFFFPTLRIFDCPKSTPEVVSKQIQASFKLFFTDPSSAANRVRSAVESLLTVLKIPKRKRNKKGDIYTLTLHARIGCLSAKHSGVKDFLLAIKWLGNTGSHTDSLTQSDVLDAYEMLEHCLINLYGDGKKLADMAKAINRKKGPVRKR